MANYLETLKKIERLCSFVNLQDTGTPKEFAMKLGISERSVYKT